MYTGFILWILGWAIFHGAVVSLGVGFVGIGNILYWRQLEDENLEKLYGEVYKEYRQKHGFKDDFATIKKPLKEKRCPSNHAHRFFRFLNFGVCVL